MFHATSRWFHASKNGFHDLSMRKTLELMLCRLIITLNFKLYYYE